MAQNRKKLLRSALEIVLGRGAAAVVSLGFLAYFARVLPKPVLGLVAVQAAVVMLVKILTDLGFHVRVLRESAPLLREGRIEEAVRRDLAGATLTRVAAATLLSVGLAALGLLFVGPLGSAIPGLDLRLAIPFACGHVLLKTYQYILAPIYHAQDRFWIESVLDSGSATVEKVFAFGLFAWGGVDHYFTGLMLGQGVTLAIAAGLQHDILRRFRLRDLELTGSWEAMVRHLPDYQRVLYRRGFRQVDRLVIAGLLPMAQVANYHVARQGTQFLKFVVRSFADPLMVRLADDPTLREHSGDRKLFYWMVILIPLAVAVGSPWLIYLLGGAEYGDAWPLMALLAISFVFYGLSEYQFAIITMTGPDEAPVRLEAVSGLVGVATTVLLVTVAGEVGAVSGQLTQFLLLYLGGRLVTRHLVRQARARARTDTPVTP